MVSKSSIEINPAGRAGGASSATYWRTSVGGISRTVSLASMGTAFSLASSRNV